MLAIVTRRSLSPECMRLIFGFDLDVGPSVLLPSQRSLQENLMCRGDDYHVPFLNAVSCIHFLLHFYFKYTGTWAL
jgi:hypothetical protein